MKLLVTGGAGFVGSNFVHRTLENRTDVEIVVLDALTYAGKMANLAGALESIDFVLGNVLDSKEVERLVAECDLVVHFAAESHNDNSLHDPLPFLETNVIGTFNLIQACVKHDVRFHHISTDEVFGDMPLDALDKFKPESPLNPSSPYSATKASSDLLVSAWIRSFGLKATISNCSNNYGPRQHEEKLIPRTIMLAATGAKPKVFGDGLNIRDWIHVDDHTDGIWAVIDRGQLGETYLLGANCERTNLQVIRTILEKMGLEEDFVEYVQDRPGHDLRYAIDASKTISDLGWQPQYESFEDGIGPVIQHYLELERWELNNK